jgi:hypothetical protein
MNKGDKVVCIKTYIFGLTEYYTQGKEYKILSVGTKNLYVISNVYTNGTWFGRNEVDNKHFRKYFITLAEWREQQIKSVIDE